MKIFGLVIKSGSTNADSMLAVTSSFRGQPLASKTEWFKSEAQRSERCKQIEKAVDEIGLVAWLVSLENIESELIESSTPEGEKEGM